MAALESGVNTTERKGVGCFESLRIRLVAKASPGKSSRVTAPHACPSRQQR
jgi:hypothetical protein